MELVKCEFCQNSLWMLKSIKLELHHKNGINDDNRLENLELLCPNCHAYTDNYRGKNINAPVMESIHVDLKHPCPNGIEVS